MKNRFVENGRSLVSRVNSGADLKQDIARAVGMIGGFDKLVEPGDTVMVKPNFNTSDPPPGSSDPEFVKGVIELLYEHGAGRVILGESSMFMLSTRKTMAKAGMLDLAQEAGAELALFDEGKWVVVETGGQYLKKVGLAQAALDAPKIVYVGCLKTHFKADFTLSLKLAMGFVRGHDRIGMHMRQLREKLVDLNLAIAPDLIVIDGRRIFISGGPSTGEAREAGVVMASGDRVAIDVEGLKVIQSYHGHDLVTEPWEVPMIRQAAALGLGASSEEEYRLVGDQAV